MKPQHKLYLPAVLFVLVTLSLILARNQVASVAAQLQDDSIIYLPLAYKPRPTSTPTPNPTITNTPQPGATRTPTRSATVVVPQGMILVNHDSVDLFDHIPNEYLALARGITVVFLDRSVGQNISEGLSCLSAHNDWAGTQASCRRDYTGISGSTWLSKTYSQTDLNNGTVPSSIMFDPDTVRYNRSNWDFEFYQESDWEDLVAHFITSTVPSNLGSKQVLTFEFSYLSVGSGSNIANSTSGFFVDQPKNGYYNNRLRWDISDIEDFQAQNPNKIFFFWTSSLARGIGSAESTTFNNQVRQYAIQNTKPLLDVADILSHDPNGNPCYDNRDGVQYCTESGNCENNPNDGQNNPAICQAYTTETEGGHLGSVSGGKIRVAKAFWVLMAQIAGWQP